ncbi:DUF3225 domain-containing protein [Lichenicola cladoniae]|uniref:DUF3225 domain-containing protein n=1 Tax=Lichenicola cladoniae TaxID=1484109 RepID=A0A6M8HLM2_9PROT|nr:AtzH-like domain-containing protein [Lichenicola cladoniae]NPD66046.1 DUF3225 domain-containing protein [Acetobacteraceae bacterium]QKE89226.1 DUF3225 domain-containing protein [Lichenicola cladoniae]
MKINDIVVLAEVTAAFEAYERALMMNDIISLDSFFWQSAHVVRYGVTENLYGTNELAAFRRGRVGGAPNRLLKRVSITTYGDDFGTACAEYGRDGSRATSRQIQSWVRFPDG